MEKMPKRGGKAINTGPSKRSRRYNGRNNKIAQENNDESFENKALQIAINHDNTKVATKLLKSNVNVNATYHLQHSPLQLAVIRKNKVLVKALLVAGACLEHRNIDGQTALHLVFDTHTTQDSDLCIILHLLLNNKAYVNALDKLGRTPLHYASAKASWMAGICCLISSGADMSIKDNCGHTALQLALNKNRTNVTAAAILLMHGANDNLNAADSSGGTFLHYAVTSSTTVLPLYLINTLISKGANISVKNGNGQTPLHLSLQETQSDLTVASTLLDLGAGADVNVEDCNGTTPLHLTAAHPSPESCALLRQMLWSYAGEMNKVDKSGGTPIDSFLRSSRVDPTKWGVFREYAFKLHCVNLLPKMDFEFDFTLMDNSAGSVKTKCLIEVDKMKKIKLGPHTLFNIFTNQHNPVHFENPKLIRYESSIKSLHFRKKFPIYWDIILTTFYEKKQRLNLLNKAQECMENPRISELRRMILVLLNNDDLLNVIMANQ